MQVRVLSPAPSFMSGSSAVGSASVSGTEGRGFKSRLPDHKFELGDRLIGMSADFDSASRKRIEGSSPSPPAKLQRGSSEVVYRVQPSAGSSPAASGYGRVAELVDAVVLRLSKKVSTRS